MPLQFANLMELKDLCNTHGLACLPHITHGLSVWYQWTVYHTWYRSGLTVWYQWTLPSTRTCIHVYHTQPITQNWSTCSVASPLSANQRELKDFMSDTMVLYQWCKTERLAVQCNCILPTTQNWKDLWGHCILPIAQIRRTYCLIQSECISNYKCTFVQFGKTCMYITCFGGLKKKLKFVVYSVLECVWVSM